jgi:hypothetical protein
MNANKEVIIFSGNNQRAIIAFCRFAVKNSIPFHIISSGNNDPILLTEYKDKILFTRKNRGLDFDTILNELINHKKKYSINELVILPSSEYLNRFLIEYKNLFKDHGIIIPLVDKEIYNSISDKYSFSGICRDKGFVVPRESECYKELDFPFVSKPKTYFNSDNNVQQPPQIITSHKEIERIDNNNENLYYQEYIDGECYYLLYYISQNNNHIIYSQENLVQQGGGGSMIASRSSNLHKDSIAYEYLELLLELKFSGLIMIELKKYKGTYYMIEANPRLWGPSQLFVDANVPIFHCFIKELGFELDSSSKPHKPSNYLWAGGIRESYKKFKELKYYNFSQVEFINEIPKLMQSEIYRRTDTYEVYINENFQS